MSQTQVAATDGWLKTSQAIGLGVVLVIVHVGVLALLSRDVGIQLVALELAVCYGIYLGFVLTRGDVWDLWIELSFVGVGLVLVGLGLWHRPEWLALGWALHGGWDLLHHRDRHVIGVRGVPVWYVSLCAFFDFALAVVVLVML